MMRWYDLIKNAPNFLEHTGFLTLRSFISVVMDFVSIAETVSASQDEKVWVEIQSYRDREHLDEFMANMEKDKSDESLYQQYISAITPGSRTIMRDLLASEPKLELF
jgi:hypothetical protein